LDFVENIWTAVKSLYEDLKKQHTRLSALAYYVVAFVHSGSILRQRDVKLSDAQYHISGGISALKMQALERNKEEIIIDPII